MNVERFKKLKNRYEFKKRNGVDTTEEFLEIIKEYKSFYPNMTPEEVDQLVLRDYCKSYKGSPYVDDFTNIQYMLRYFKKLIKEFQNIVQVDNNIKYKVSEEWKQKIISKAEEKLSVLLKNLSDVILDYVDVPIGTQDEENSSLWKENEELEKDIIIYMRPLDEDMDIRNLDISRFYYRRIIPFYQNIYQTAKEALEQNNKIHLWQVAEVSTCKIVFRCKLMADILR